jgi:hypothetical protein
MDEATRIILDRRLAELEKGFEISDKNISKVIQIIKLKTPGKEPEDVKRKSAIMKANSAHLKLRDEMIKGFRESMARATTAATSD